MDTLSGKGYERQVMRHLAENDQTIAFELDVKVQDTSGKYSRQIDIWLPNTREIVECKHHSRRVSVGVIDALLGTIDDVGASGGRIFSHNGFTPNALARAKKSGIVCITLPYEAQSEEIIERTGSGYYSGDYISLCGPGSGEVEGFGRINYGDGEFDETPICVDYSVDWGNPKMHGFVAYIILNHYLGRPPSDEAIAGFVEEHGDRFEAGQEWDIAENKIWNFAM